MLNFNISHPYVIKYPYFMNTINLRLKEGFGDERKPKNKVKSR
jgi:hypothetical protein